MSLKRKRELIDFLLSESQPVEKKIGKMQAPQFALLPELPRDLQLKMISAWSPIEILAFAATSHDNRVLIADLFDDLLATKYEKEDQKDRVCSFVFNEGQQCGRRPQVLSPSPSLPGMQRPKLKLDCRSFCRLKVFRNSSFPSYRTLLNTTLLP